MNRLASESSPYLRQHADNPVDWYPWGDEAFARARAEDRPVFLSIGYSACHWCHVMAHESFEDEATAAQMNDGFVCIKVDREERPDVDAVYMEAVQAITGSGGWPMSVFLTPDGRPFFGGTYFPPVDRPGMSSFRTVLGALTDVWDDRRDEVEEQATELAGAIASRSRITRTDGTPAGDVGPHRVRDLVDRAVVDLARRFDADWGGFGPAPKFPNPTLVDLCLAHDVAGRSVAAPGDPGASRHMATATLDGMAAGGLWDHLGGGFARYSTDVEWLVPHFEKMLYDQAGLLRAYLHAWQVTDHDDYLDVATGIVDYVLRDLADPRGGLCSAEDADSEGVEGRFYVWTPDQLGGALTGTPAEGSAGAVADFFGVTERGNFEGRSILRRPVGGPLRGDGTVEAARRALFEARSHRVRPGLDDKVLTEWNAMFCSALAEAAAATGSADWSRSAEGIAEFLWSGSGLRRHDGRWLRSWQHDGGPRHLAYAADYAWLVDCLTRLGELTGRAEWTRRAVITADGLLELFLDPDEGGFFTTGNDAEALIVRTKDLLDGATPSANAVAALALARLGALTGAERFTEAARGVVGLLDGLLDRHPTAFAHALSAARLLEEGVTEIVVAGDRPDLVGAVHHRWLPTAVLAWGEPTDSPLWADRDGDRAFVCRNYTCGLPAADVATLQSQLDASAAR